jgi:gliding motility associated protien GldN
MMKKVGVLIIAALILFGFQAVQAQTQETENDSITDQSTWSGLDLVYQRQHIKEKKPIPYEPIREADIMWSKLVWRIIDMRQKKNQPLYFPTVAIGERMSLIDVLMEAIEKGELTAYKPSLEDSNEFKEIMSYDQVLEEFEAQDRVQTVYDPVTGEPVETVIEGTLRKDQVMQLLVKEMWFFDRKRSTMEVRIIGLCPIRLYYKDEDIAQENLQRKKLFWVKFPEARDILAQKEVYNPFNDAERRSYDEIFHKRFFEGFIVQESNVFNNRMVQQYTMGIGTLLESERIENFIFQYEHDLWEY